MQEVHHEEWSIFPVPRVMHLHQVRVPKAEAEFCFLLEALTEPRLLEHLDGDGDFAHQILTLQDPAHAALTDRLWSDHAIACPPTNQHLLSKPGDGWLPLIRDRVERHRLDDIIPRQLERRGDRPCVRDFRPPDRPPRPHRTPAYTGSSRDD